MLICFIYTILLTYFVDRFRCVAFNHQTDLTRHQSKFAHLGTSKRMSHPRLSQAAQWKDWTSTAEGAKNKGPGARGICSFVAGGARVCVCDWCLTTSSYQFFIIMVVLLSSGNYFKKMCVCVCLLFLFLSGAKSTAQGVWRLHHI